MVAERIGPLNKLSLHPTKTGGMAHECFKAPNFPGWIFKICSDDFARKTTPQQQSEINQLKDHFGDFIPPTGILKLPQSKTPIVVQREVRGEILRRIKPEELNVDQLLQLRDFLTLVITYTQAHGEFDLIGCGENIKQAKKTTIGKWKHRIQQLMRIRTVFREMFDVFNSSNLMFDENQKLYFVDCVSTHQINERENEKYIERLYMQLKEFLFRKITKNHLEKNQKIIEEIIAQRVSMVHSESHFQ